MTGRRLIQDETKEYRTLLVGGVKAKRLSVVEYETSIEVLNQYGETSCLKGGRTDPREGAAGAFYNSGGETSQLQLVVRVTSDQAPSWLSSVEAGSLQTRTTRNWLKVRCVI